MKFINISGLLVFLFIRAFAQHGHMGMGGTTSQTRLPFYIRKGRVDIYNLYLADTAVNYTGKKRMAMAINGAIPAPTLKFTEGDTAEIYVHNQMMMETSIHWHGVILPNREDGVSYLTTAPIMPGETHLFKFPLVQHGTYWYHSHTMTQQQSGLYGAFIVYPKNETPQKEYTLLLSDWTDENPEEVERSLHTRNDWYSVKKGSTQSYGEALTKGYFGTKLLSEWKRMAAMDVSDVYYNRFLANGKPVETAPQFKAGDTVRLRIVNGSSSTYFWLNYAGGKIKVIANDGESVQPVEVDRMLIAVAETYDVKVVIPKDGSYELLATAEDRSGSASLMLGKGPENKVKPLPRLKYFEGMKMMNGMMGMNGRMTEMNGMKMSNQMMDMNRVMYPELADKPNDNMDNMSGMDMGEGPVTLNYGMLKATHNTTLPPGPVKELRFNLTGNMNRYVWTINNKTVSETDKIKIKDGENVRIILYNGTMMRHPMHLHGHYFRLLNGQGDYSPLKNTLDIMPMETDTLEFAAQYSGDWFFHCHILYHMMAGMGRIFSYENSPPNPEIPDTTAALQKVYADDERFFFSVGGSLENNGSIGGASLENTRWGFQTSWKLGLNDAKGYESQTIAGRYLGEMQWLFAYAGFDYHFKKIAAPEKNLFGQQSDEDNLHTAIIGVAYTLPMFMVAEARVDANGKFRLQLGRDDIAVTSRLRFSLMGNTDREYAFSARYIVSKNFAFSAGYDSDMGMGGGISLKY